VGLLFFTKITFDKKRKIILFDGKVRMRDKKEIREPVRGYRHYGFLEINKELK